jgi:hypothetical protein
MYLGMNLEAGEAEQAEASALRSLRFVQRLRGQGGSVRDGGSQRMKHAIRRVPTLGLEEVGGSRSAGHRVFPESVTQGNFSTCSTDIQPPAVFFSQA